jgi:hypothetical protein
MLLFRGSGPSTRFPPLGFTPLAAFFFHLSHEGVIGEHANRALPIFRLLEGVYLGLKARYLSFQDREPFFEMIF